MIRLMRLAILAAALMPLAAAANPTGGTVTSGSATISASGSTVTVNTSTTGTIINWTSFSIATGETTRINQPSAASVTLNRVTGPSSSSINGSLQSNGQVFLTNPNGIVFGSTASVNVAGFVASTLNMTDADFLSGNLRFAGPIAPAGIVQNGQITASDYAALIGASVTVHGTVSAGPGGIVIAAGAPVTLTKANDVLTSVSAGSGVPGAIITVDGVLDSPGPVIIQVGGGSSLLPHPITPPNLVILPSGPGSIINFQSFNTGGGVAVNFGNPTAAQAAVATTTGSGNVQIYGTLTATGGPAVATGVAVNLEKREVSF